ncbi:MAG: sensor histidine kinase [Sporolactobacillus sp.]
MKLRAYLSDQRLLLFFYTVGNIFLFIYLSVEPSVSLSLGSTCYLLLVLLFFFSAYLFLDYLRRSAYLRELDAIRQGPSNDRFFLVRNAHPATNEQEHFQMIFEEASSENIRIVQLLKKEAAENKDFVMSWVHEIKTPIAAGIMMLEDSETDGYREQEQKLLKNKLNQIDHYVEQALYYSRTDSFSIDYLIQESSLQRIIYHVLKKEAELFIIKKIHVTLQQIDQRVLTDGKWLEFILDQLLSNAGKYTEVSGNVIIRCEQTPHGLRLSIRDDGCGIRKEDIGRVFDRGYTGYTGREKAHATGMGLFLAKKLAMKLGHELTVESSENEYTVVCLLFSDHTDLTTVARAQVTKV